MFDLNEIDEKIALAQKEVNILKLHRKEIVEMSEDERLAEHLHELTCNVFKHEDQCSWNYEKTTQYFDANNKQISYSDYQNSKDPGVKKVTTSEWNAYSHSTFLEKAQKMLKVSDYETIINIIKISKDR